ncbi:TPA: pyrimidine 5'-nucleotidase, partial [Yersinia enterocolitica]|nr:pyrimidine 5'-nucleotidase [Yersinia enterocolitica]
AVVDDNIAPRYQVSSLAELQKLLLA